MAQESGVETPTIDDLIRLDRKRKGKNRNCGILFSALDAANITGVDFRCVR